MSRGFKFVPHGTQFQVNQRTRMVAVNLRRDAAGLHGQAQRMERLAEKIEAHHASGLTISARLLCKVIHIGINLHAVYALVGLRGYEDKRAIFDRLLGPRDSGGCVIEHSHVVSQEPVLSTPSLAKEQAAPSFAIANVNVVAQASEIARIASGTEVDWSREPLNERERAIRARFIEQNLSSNRLIILAVTMRLERRPLASDIAAAAILAQRLQMERRIEDQRKEYGEIADQLDEEQDRG